MSDAELRGIDVAELKGERFSHPSHYRMLREHADRVREFELHQSFDRYVAAAKAAAQAVVDAEAVAEAVVRNEKKRVVKRYKFTDAQLAVAERSLSR